LDGERAGGERKLTKATNAAKRAPNGGTTCGGACYSGDGSLRKDERSKARRKENGEGGVLGCVRGSPLQAETRGGQGEIVGAGGRLRRFETEREKEERLGRRGKELTSGARLSVRERGKGEKGRLGRGPGREGKGAGRSWAERPSPGRRGGKGNSIFFQNNFSNSFFKCTVCLCKDVDDDLELLAGEDERPWCCYIWSTTHMVQHACCCWGL